LFIALSSKNGFGRVEDSSPDVRVRRAGANGFMPGFVFSVHFLYYINAADRALGPEKVISLQNLRILPRRPHPIHAGIQKTDIIWAPTRWPRGT
jgi:hypothetical protein